MITKTAHIMYKGYDIMIREYYGCLYRGYAGGLTNGLTFTTLEECIACMKISIDKGIQFGKLKLTIG